MRERGGDAHEGLPDVAPGQTSVASLPATPPVVVPGLGVPSGLVADLELSHTRGATFWFGLSYVCYSRSVTTGFTLVGCLEPDAPTKRSTVAGALVVVRTAR